MTMINEIHTHRGNGIVTMLRNAVAGLAEGFAMRAEYQRTVDELQRLNERELEDIGIIRAEIPAIAARRTMEKFT